MLLKIQNVIQKLNDSFPSLSVDKSSCHLASNDFAFVKTTVWNFLQKIYVNWFSAGGHAVARDMEWMRLIENS